jgi:MoaA/NifB/PqqE/SkfB family radical SAM enzyme
MESIYWVMAWACHRKCRHCYEDRFRPYVRADLERVVAEAERNTPRVLANLPERMTYLDRDDPSPDGSLPEKTGRIILSGGEALLDPVRTRVTYKVIEGLVARYRGVGGVKVIVQTTGDLLTAPIVRDLLDRGVWMISVAGVDDFHVGMEGEAKQAAFKAGLAAMMEAEGMRPSGVSTMHRKWFEEDGPLFSFFGATPDSWIGKLWPRGRAWENGLSHATLADNFCNRWSGGLNFLRHRHNGSEVSIEPDGSVYPCCIKTRLPLGNLTEEPLIGILDSLAGDPVYEAINAGRPEQMGLAHGWSEAMFIEKSHTTDPKGRPYANLCIGCDRFHEEVLGARIAAARERRRALGARRPTVTA